jgi:hypothetical protein
MLVCKAVSTPLSVLEKLAKNVGDLLDSETATRYRSIVGGLQLRNSYQS